MNDEAPLTDMEAESCLRSDRRRGRASASGAGDILDDGDCGAEAAKLAAAALTADNRGSRIFRVGVEEVLDWVMVMDALDVGGAFDAGPSEGIDATGGTRLASGATGVGTAGVGVVRRGRFVIEDSVAIGMEIGDVTETGLLCFSTCLGLRRPRPCLRAGTVLS